jgi:hypothetical protein
MFAFTGFGYQWPSDDYSRIANILVMIFGTCIVFVAISNVMVNRLNDLQQKRKYTDFDRMEEIYANRQWRIAMNVAASIGILLAAGLVFWWLEDWTFVTAVYFAAQIATVSVMSSAQLHRSQFMRLRYVMLQPGCRLRRVSNQTRPRHLGDDGRVLRPLDHPSRLLRAQLHGDLPRAVPSS